MIDLRNQSNTGRKKSRQYSWKFWRPIWFQNWSLCCVSTDFFIYLQRPQFKKKKKWRQMTPYLRCLICIVGVKIYLYFVMSFDSLWKLCYMKTKYSSSIYIYIFVCGNREWAPTLLWNWEERNNLAKVKKKKIQDSGQKVIGCDGWRFICSL